MLRRACGSRLLLATLLLAGPAAFAQHATPNHEAARPAPQPHHAPARPSYGGGGAPAPRPSAPPRPGYPAPNYARPNAPAPNYARPNYPAPNYAAPNGFTAGHTPTTGRMPYVPYGPTGRTTPSTGPRLTGPHLGNWLQNHQGQSFNSQADSLRQERGFSQLPQQQQQRLIDRLHQIDSMPPPQRQRTLGRIENMERLAPERRQEVRASAQELGAMEPGRKQQVRGAFRSLRELPPEQREQVLNSPEYRSQYSERERQVLGNLLSVEPYQPQ